MRKHLDGALALKISPIVTRQNSSNQHLCGVSTRSTALIEIICHPGERMFYGTANFRTGLIRLFRLFRTNFQRELRHFGPESQPTRAFHSSSTAFPPLPRQVAGTLCALCAFFALFYTLRAKASEAYLYKAHTFTRYTWQTGHHRSKRTTSFTPRATLPSAPRPQLVLRGAPLRTEPQRPAPQSWFRGPAGPTL
jgi:hypothetical protein